MEEKNINKKKKQKRKDIIFVIIGICSVALWATGAYLLFFSKDAKDTSAGYERQEEEENLADDYLKYLLEKAEEETESSKAFSEASAHSEDSKAYVTPQPHISMGDIEQIIQDDPNYFERNGITYTPDYAQGYMAFVLEIPTAGIKRGVYSGTWEEIAFDLDIWMVTLARPDYELGNTHLCIYGHNHTAQNLSFNELYKVQTGDEFYLYADSGYYVYEVNRVFAESRDSVTKNYADNFEIGADKCYIMTCGRDYYLIEGKSSRYKDIVVEGVLKEHLSLTEYAARLAEEK